MDYEKITLTLGELKEYFKIWHENNFNALHNEGTISYINEYLTNRLEEINIIIDIKTSLIYFGKFISQIIDGNSNLTESSTLNNVINELANKNINLNNINLTSLSSQILNHSTLINTIQDNMATKSDVTKLRNDMEDVTGVRPKQLQTQLIPVVGIGTDLNDYKIPGLYRSKDAANTASLSNVPEKAQNSAFTLIVLEHMDNSVKQILLTAEKTDSGNSIYTRNYNHSQSNPWGDKWYELYGNHNTQPLQMQVEWSDDESNPTTYTLLQIR